MGMKLQDITVKQDIAVEDKVWLGIVYPENIRAGHTLITPLAFSENNKWQHITPHEVHQYFPNNGKVVLFKDISHLQARRLYQFYPEKNHNLSNSGDPKYSIYLTSNLQNSSLSQILDYTNKLSDLFEAPDLLYKGLDVKDCICQSIYIRYKDRLYGPIKIDRDGDYLRPVAYIQSNPSGGKALLVSVYQLPAHDILQLGDAPNQFLCFDENILASPIDQADWSLSQVVIKKILQARRSIDSETVEKIQLVDKCIRDLAMLSNQEGPTALRIEPATLKRAEYIVQHQLERLDRLDDARILFEEVLADHPKLKSAIEQEIQRKAIDIQHEANRLAQQQLEQLQENLQQTKTQIADQEAQLAKTKKLIDKAKQEHERLQTTIDALEQELQGQLTRLRQEPLRVFAELQFTSSLLSYLMQSDQNLNQTVFTSYTSKLPAHGNRVIQQYPLAGNMIDWHTDNPAHALPDNVTYLQKKYWLHPEHHVGFQPDGIIACIAALLVGFVPMINRILADAFLQVIGQTLTNNRVWTVPVPVTAVSPLDLFGTIDTDRQLFIPAPGGLADIVLQARTHPQELGLVLLEGLDRVPGLPVYAPLLRQYQACTETSASQIAPLNLFHPRALVPDDPYRELACFSWPQNLLLMATRDNDITSLPIPAACEPYIVHLERLEVRRITTIHKHGQLTPSHVSLQQWQRWQQFNWETAAHSIEELQGLNNRQKTFIQILLSLQVKDHEVEKIRELLWPERSENSPSTKQEGRRKN